MLSPLLGAECGSSFSSADNSCYSQTEEFVAPMLLLIRQQHNNNNNTVTGEEAQTAKRLAQKCLEVI